MFVYDQNINTYIYEMSLDSLRWDDIEIIAPNEDFDDASSSK